MPKSPPNNQVLQLEDVLRRVLVKLGILLSDGHLDGAELLLVAKNYLRPTNWLVSGPGKYDDDIPF